MSSESEAAVKNNDANQPLKSLGKYLIERKLGQGGMGTVYLARHTGLNKMVALKVLPQDKAKNPTLVKRFNAEAQAAAKLEHPNIVAVFDSGEADGYLFIAMEYVDGIDLFEQVKKRGPIPVKRSIEIIKQVASALQKAYEQNIVHRDIKPSNLLLRNDGVVKLTDLGLARSIDDTLETNITRAGTTVGTVDYMAPEQARSSKSADIRSDIYSLGCTWYQMLTGEPPFPEGSLTNKLQAHATKPLPDPREKNENIPEGLFAVLQRMTAKKPEDRYQNPAELLDELAHAKLTKAAFSNEIFSDLSDDDISVADYSEEDFDNEEEPHEDEPLQRKSQSREPDESDEISSKPTRRKTRSRDEDEHDEPTRRKGRPRDGETNPVNDTQPLKPFNKSSQKSREDVEHEPPSASRSSKRLNSESDDSELDERPSSKRKRSSPTDDDDKSPGLKSGKSPSSKESNEKKSSKNSPKPLPPKRQAVLTENDEQAKPNTELLKYFGIIAGLLLLIGGTGYLVFQWSNTFDSVSQTIPVNTASVANDAPTIPPPVKPEHNEQSSVTINVVDAPKTGASERPAADYDIAKQPLPSWATSDASEPRDLPILTVGPGVTTTTHFSNLEDALKNAEKNGGFVRLMGNGPFLISNFEIRSEKKLLITAATPQDQPLIIFKPREADGTCGLIVNNGVLDLRGLHFTLDRSANSVNAPSTMISVVDGQLFVRNCSFTTTGRDPIAATAVAFTSKKESQSVPTLEPQVFLDRITVRGNGLTGLHIDRASSDAVIQDSLFLTGTAPAIDLDGHLPTNVPDAPLSKPRRTIRVLRTTICARQQAVEIATDDSSRPPSTAILFQDSVCSAEGSGNTAVVVSATRWPSVTSKTGGWMTNLNWSSISSLYLGFDRLMDLDKSFKVSGLDDWQRVWGKKFESIQFQPILWQETLISELSSALPHDFDTSKLPYSEVKTSKGEFPGCPVSRLNVPSAISQDRMLAMSQRPRLPSIVLKPNDPTQVKKIDLMKEDLGAVLNRNEWQSGAVFEASGSGIRLMSPARIVGKSLRIVFRQSDGPLLRLQPKVSDQKANVEYLGLFNVDNGLIDLQFATIEASQSAKGAAPPWLISGKNASVILKGCQLNGPLQQDLEQHQGLIHWTTSSGFQPPDGSEPPFLSINDSMLMSHGIGIRAECAQGTIFIRNSIVAIRGAGINLIPDFAKPKVAPIVDLEHVTFSTTKSAIRVETATGTELAATPMRLYVSYCAFGPPLEFKTGEAMDSTVLECVGPVREQKLIEWWGTSNGFAKEVRTLLRQSDTNPIHFASEWIAACGESNEYRLLTGSKGVNLSSSLPNRWTNLKLTSFILDPHSQGATWADGGRPIGADIRLVEDAMVAKKPTMEKKPSHANATLPPNPGAAPVPKGKNIGF